MEKLEKEGNPEWMKATKKICEAANPQNKAEMWKLFFSADEESEISKWGPQDYKNSFSGWNQPQHRHIIQTIQTSFFEEITQIIKTKGRYISEQYFYKLRPMDENMTEKYAQLLQKVESSDPDNTMFIKLLKRTLSDLDLMKRGREASLEYLNEEK
jgi:hypothetical protein